MPLNEQQKKIVDNLDNTVNVAAGAGTGKTFTLTQRIVECVRKVIAKSNDASNPLEQVLGITFTNKAAAELRSRVRAALMAEAQQLDDPIFMKCALQADDSWISTIHSMATRILRDNALPFGINPDFQVLSEAESEAVFSQALENVLSQLEYTDDPRMRELFATFPIKGFTKNVLGIVDLIKSLFNCVSYMPAGLDGVRLAEVKDSPSVLMRRMYQAAEGIMPYLESDSWPEKQLAKRDVYLEEMRDALSNASEWLNNSGDFGFLDIGFDATIFLDTLFAFPPTTDKYPSSPKDFKGPFRAYRDKYRNIAEDALASVGVRLLVSLLDIANKVQDETIRIKSEGKPMLDNNDLLLRCKMELSKPENRDILDMYSQQFRYIMLDEFQDTDRLQMDLVGLISRASCETDMRDDSICESLSLHNVCTVGDMQQSIYRFRGGDVRLAKQRASELAGYPGTSFELTGNYRSHKDVLDGVEMVFSRPNGFGNSFLRLEAKATSLSSIAESAFLDHARVSFDFLHFPRGRGVTQADARICAAHIIAREFARLKSCGVGVSNMALLLGRLTYADVYADVFAQYGLDSMITGGSGFGRTDQAYLVLRLLEYAVNRNDTSALFDVLTSPLFCISDTDLMLLADYGRNEGSKTLGSYPLTQGFSNLCEKIGSFKSIDDLSESGFGEGVVQACATLSAFVADCRSGHVSSALRELIASSGLLNRISSSEEGIDISELPIVANLNKAIGIVASLESGCSGMATLADAYKKHIATAKEAPGILSTGTSDYISIMTVHASKGLEFDHVAIADLDDGSKPAPAFVVENVGDSTLVSLRAPKGSFRNESAHKNSYEALKFSYDEDAGSDIEDAAAAFLSSFPGHMHSALSLYSKDEELAEAQRLLYVAMTRARESLKVVHIKNSKAESGYTGIYANVYDALCEHFNRYDSGFPDEACFVQKPFGFFRHTIEEDDQLFTLPENEDIQSRISVSQEHDIPAQAALDGAFKTVEYLKVSPRIYERKNIMREGVYSYTSLHTDSGMPTSMHSEVSSESNSLNTDDIPQRSFTADSDKATNLGTAFHRLAQIAIINKNVTGSCVLEMPDEALLGSQIKSCSLGDRASGRLESALRRWLSSDLCLDFASHENTRAEVPFALHIDLGDGDGFTLEGEMDALADNNDGACMLIDYKTGGSPDETCDALFRKHLLQAQCYAFALLNAGYSEIRAYFVRVEQVDQSHSETSEQPQAIKYSFTISDKDALRSEIVKAYCAVLSQ